jgi:hypothetical protein
MFDSRPLSKVTNVPSPPERPYRLGEGAREVPAVQPAPAAKVQYADALASEPVHSAEEPATSPVSAYAPVSYDSGAAVSSGRGLY